MKTKRFIVIDDDTVTNTLCRLIIKGASKTADIQTFDIPETGFEFIKEEYAKPNDDSAILLLDINMPTWSGWDFLDNFDTLDETVKNQVKIYIHSSSVDPLDKERAHNNKHVVDYIVKPLTRNVILSLIEE